MDHENSSTTELKYSLTFLQRFFNPIEVVIYRIFQLLGIVVLCSFFVVDTFSVWIPWVFSWAILFFVYRRAFLGGALFLLTRDASRCIVVVIRPDLIGFGRKKTEYWVFRSLYRVHRGLFGTNLIRHCWGRYTIVVPESAIPFAQLRQLVEGNG